MWLATQQWPEAASSGGALITALAGMLARMLRRNARWREGGRAPEDDRPRNTRVRASIWKTCTVFPFMTGILSRDEEAKAHIARSAVGAIAGLFSDDNA
jgi:hypothetical protein